MNSNRLRVEVRELISREIIQVDGNTLASYTLELMENSGSSSVVVTRDGSPYGIITFHDIVFHSSHWEEFKRMKSWEISSAPLIIISGSTPFYEAFWLMNERGVKHLALVDGGEVAGVLNDKDMLQILTEVEFLSIKRVDEIMHGSVISVPLTSSISDVMRKMVEKRVSSIVVEDRNRAVGILTERDALQLAKRGSRSLKESVKEYMHSPVITIEANSSAIQAEKLMLKHNIRRLIVTDRDGYMVGILSQHDLMNGVSGVYVAILKQTIESLSADLDKESKKSSFTNLTQYMVENIKCMVFFINRDGEFLYTNESAKDSLGYHSDDFQEMSIYDIDPSMNEGRWNRSWQLVKERRSSRSDGIYIKKNGEYIDVSTTINYIYYEGEELLFVISRDISEERQEREGLRESNRTMQKYLDFTNATLITLNREGRVMTVSKGASEFLNIKQSELYGREWFKEFVPEDEYETIKAQFLISLRDRNFREGYIEYSVVLSEDRIIKNRWRYSCIKDKNGRLKEVLLTV